MIFWMDASFLGLLSAKQYSVMARILGFGFRIPYSLAGRIQALMNRPGKISPCGAFSLARPPGIPVPPIRLPPSLLFLPEPRPMPSALSLGPRARPRAKLPGPRHRPLFLAPGPWTHPRPWPKSCPWAFLALGGHNPRPVFCPYVGKHARLPRAPRGNPPVWSWAGAGVCPGSLIGAPCVSLGSSGGPWGSPACPKAPRLALGSLGLPWRPLGFLGAPESPLDPP